MNLAKQMRMRALAKESIHLGRKCVVLSVWESIGVGLRKCCRWISLAEVSNYVLDKSYFGIINLILLQLP